MVARGATPAGARDEPRSLSALIWWWGPAAAHAVLLFVLSSFSQLPAQPGGLSDKHMHFAMFGLLAALILRGLARGRAARVGAATVFATVALTAAYGASDEIHQMFVPGRSASWLDLLADTAGAIAVAGAIWACVIIRRRLDL